MLSRNTRPHDNSARIAPWPLMFGVSPLAVLSFRHFDVLLLSLEIVDSSGIN